MKKTYAEFGIPSDDIEATRIRVEALFGEELSGVSSDTWGLYYTSENWSKDNVIRVYTNFSPDYGEGFWNAPDHKQLPLILEISRSPNFDEIHELVMSDTTLGAVLISRDEIDV